MNAQPEQDAGDNTEVVEKKKSPLVNMLIWGVIAAVGIGAGFATPMFLMGGPDKDVEAAEKEPEEMLPIPDPTEEVGFVEFKELVVNFNDPRFSRYLKMSFSLQVPKSQMEDVAKLLEEKNDVLKNWLIGHIADKKVEDIRGKQGTNRLRREIHDAFNQLLFKDGIERIQDVLFKELNIQ